MSHAPQDRVDDPSIEDFHADRIARAFRAYRIGVESEWSPDETVELPHDPYLFETFRILLHDLEIAP